MKNCLHANAERPAAARVSSVQFHPCAQVVMVAALDNSVSLFQVGHCIFKSRLGVESWLPGNRVYENHQKEYFVLPYRLMGKQTLKFRASIWKSFRSLRLVLVLMEKRF